jgi:hypothetical protein
MRVGSGMGVRLLEMVFGHGSEAPRDGFGHGSKAPRDGYLLFYKLQILLRQMLASPTAQK